MPCHCDDYSRSQLLRQSLARAGQGLPSIERGMPMPAGTGLSRRSFLSQTAGLAVTLFGASALSPAAFEAGIENAAAAAPNSPVLVSIWLSGGIDSLSLLAPVADPTYQSMRPTLKNAPSVNPLDTFTEDTRLQWHPKAAPLRDLHLVGKLTMIPGVGWPGSHGSHFVSRHFWEVGELNEGGRVGWLGRYLDRAGTSDNPLQGLSLASSLSPAIAPGSAPVSALATPTDYQVGVRGASGTVLEKTLDAARRLGGLATDSQALAQGGAAISSMMLLRSQLAPIQGISPAPQGGASYPGGSFANQMRLLPEMLSRGLPLRCVTVQGPGGYDTHSGQNAVLPNNIDVLSKTLAAFQQDLEARGLADRVLVHVWSEFGRRVQENGGGTDHGAGGASFVIGTRASGEMVGEYPGLSSLDALGNLKSTADFRSVYCSLLEQWLGADADGIIPGASSLARPTLIKA